MFRIVYSRLLLSTRKKFSSYFLQYCIRFPVQKGKQKQNITPCDQKNYTSLQSSPLVPGMQQQTTKQVQVTRDFDPPQSASNSDIGCLPIIVVVVVVFIVALQNTLFKLFIMLVYSMGIVPLNAFPNNQKSSNQIN